MYKENSFSDPRKDFADHLVAPTIAYLYFLYKYDFLMFQFPKNSSSYRKMKFQICYRQIRTVSQCVGDLSHTNPPPHPPPPFGGSLSGGKFVIIVVGLIF